LHAEVEPAAFDSVIGADLAVVTPGVILAVGRGIGRPGPEIVGDVRGTIPTPAEGQVVDLGIAPGCVIVIIDRKPVFQAQRVAGNASYSTPASA